MTEQEFLGCLEKEKIVENVAIRLKREALPLVLWGAGDVANSVSLYLKEHNIPLTDVWVDGEARKDTFWGMRIKTREEIQGKYTEFNVIVGHSRYELGLNLQEELPEAKQVFYVPSVHYGQYENIPYEMIKQEARRFSWLCNRLDDKESVGNLIAYLNTKLTGDMSYILQRYGRQMNFFHNDIFCLSEEEVFLNVGACNGDTIKLFLEESGGKYKKILALEPDAENFAELNEYIAKERLKNIVTRKSGAWNQYAELSFQAGNGQISGIENGNVFLGKSEASVIHADCLDEMFGEEDISLIEINYLEGILEALEGCRKILMESHPKLALSVGFDLYKVLELSEYLDSLGAGYRLFLRFNRAMTSTFTLYAI